MCYWRRRVLFQFGKACLAGNMLTNSTRDCCNWADGAPNKMDRLHLEAHRCITTRVVLFWPPENAKTVWFLTIEHQLSLTAIRNIQLNINIEARHDAS
jgi:hypothetical protein